MGPEWAHFVESDFCSDTCITIGVMKSKAGGFTLLELVVVIVCVVILAVLAYILL